MNEMTSPAKITSPAILEAIPRRRLFRLLDRSTKKPILWVSSPGGSGKTTLIASYLQARSLPCLWYQFDGRDADTAAFFFYTGLAAKKAAPRKKAPLPLLTHEHLPHLIVFTERFFEELYSRLRSPSFIVFDNYQEVAATSPLQDVIIKGLSMIPEGINVIVISRSDPIQKFARLRANNMISMVGWDDVRFTLDETEDMLRRSMPKKQSSEIVARVHEKTDGWAAGLVLLLEKAKRGGITPELINKVTRGSIFDYFASEIFDRADNKTKEFLLKSAFLPQIAPATAERLTGVASSDRILSNLNHGHFFTTKQSSREASYQYHALFREYLLSKASEVFSEEEISAIEIKAASLLSEQGDFENAAALYIKAKDWPAVTGLVRSHARSLLSQGRSETVKAWIDSMPPELIEADGDLLFFKGLCLFVIDPGRGNEILEKAYCVYEKKGNVSGMFLTCSAAADNAIYSIDFASGRPWAKRLATLREKDSTLPGEEVMERLNLGIFNALALTAPDHPDMPALSEQAATIIIERRDLNLTLRVHTAMSLFYYYIWTGSHGRAKTLIDLVEKYADSPDLYEVVRGLIIVSMTLYYFITNQTDKCIAWVEKGKELAERSPGMKALQRHAMGHGMSALLSDGNIEAADKMFSEFCQNIHEAALMDKVYYYDILAWRARLSGDNASALENLLKARGLFSGFPAAEIVHDFVAAEYLNEAGRGDEADVLLAQALDCCRRMKSGFLQHYCLLVSSRIALSRGAREEGLDLLKKAMALGREGNYLNCHFWQSDIMAEHCALALEHGIEPEYVRGLIRRRNLMPDPPPLHIENWPWHLKIYTLGKFEIEKDGKVLTIGKGHRKPMELFKVLITFGAQNVREETITDILWPDAEGDAAHSAFTTTIFRLRKIVGEDAFSVKGGKVSLNVKDCWVDIMAFEYLLARLEVMRKKDEDAAMRLLEEVFALYKGPFLENDTDEHLFYSLRERLRQRFLGCIGSCAEELIRQGRHEGAIPLYKKGLEIDEFSEEFYRGLMSCYLGLGRYAEGLAVYRRCRKMLLHTFRVGPSRETEELHRALDGVK